MKTYLDCFPCFLNQALRAGRIATDDDKKIKRLLDEVGMMLRDIPLESTPPESGRLIYHKVSEITGNLDPYKKIKSESTKKALSLYPSLKNQIERSKDRLLTAIRIAIAGNVIDFGANWNFNIENEIDEVLEKDFAICDYNRFKDCLNETSEILYIGDNAGECVFDKILIEEMKKPVKYIVRDIPIINDATYEDAVQAGIDKVATILSSGTDAPGTILKTCSLEFKELSLQRRLLWFLCRMILQPFFLIRVSGFFFVMPLLHIPGDHVLRAPCDSWKNHLQEPSNFRNSGRHTFFFPIAVARPSGMQGQASRG